MCPISLSFLSICGFTEFSKASLPARPSPYEHMPHAGTAMCWDHSTGVLQHPEPVLMLVAVTVTVIGKINQHGSLTDAESAAPASCRRREVLGRLRRMCWQ